MRRFIELANFHQQTVKEETSVSLEPFIHTIKEKIQKQFSYIESRIKKAELEIYISPFEFVLLEDHNRLLQSIETMKRFVFHLEKEWEEKKTLRFVLSLENYAYVSPIEEVWNYIRRSSSNTIDQMVIRYDEHFSLVKLERLLLILYLLDLSPILTRVQTYDNKKIISEYEMIKQWEIEKKRYQLYQKIVKHFSVPVHKKE